MPAIPQHLAVPLPKGWPRRVRSAVIQVISLPCGHDFGASDLLPSCRGCSASLFRLWWFLGGLSLLHTKAKHPATFRWSPSHDVQSFQPSLRIIPRMLMHGIPNPLHTSGM
jgi:hypothetical protein